MKKLILFELRKVFSKRLALIALIGIILFSALLSFSTFQNKYAFDQNIGEGTGKTAVDRKSTRLNSSHWNKSRMPSSA